MEKRNTIAVVLGSGLLNDGTPTEVTAMRAEHAAELAKYPGAEVVVVQDEPQNQGGWPFLALNLPGELAALGETRPLHVVARKAAASPSTGSSKKHAVEQAALMARAFDR